jgi:histidyl-tRNA synthetase
MIPAIRGTHDILPGDVQKWQHVERVARDLCERYGYVELRTPVIEREELFAKGTGETTDIVQKEMYAFTDKGGERVTLRPEATPSLVRAYVEHGLDQLMPATKLYMMGPMFRYERPQKGRYRQFHQIDAEAIGYAGPDVDAELILLSARIWARLGLPRLTLHLNTLGTPESRRAYRAHLTEYFRRHASALDADSVRRLESNPLRILDSKTPAMQEIVAGSPSIMDHLDPESAAQFAGLRAHLDTAGVPYVLNPRLVRGLDYYSRTVFEWITTDLGSQDAVCSGGRYDGLVAQLGGEATPAIGWALGQERVVELMRLTAAAADAVAPAVYLLLAGDAAERAGLALAERLRDALPGRGIEVNCGGGSIKAQMKRADRSGARFALILGDDEISRGVVGLKSLRGDGTQHEVPLAGLAAELGGRLRESESIK